IQKILKGRFQLRQIGRGFEKLKIDVGWDAVLDGMVAAHHVDSFSRNGLASGELDRRIVFRIFLLDAPPQIQGRPKGALGGELCANFIPVTVENLVFSDGPHSESRGLLQTGTSEMLSDDQ